MRGINAKLYLRKANQKITFSQLCVCGGGGDKNEKFKPQGSISIAPSLFSPYTKFQLPSSIWRRDKGRTPHF